MIYHKAWQNWLIVPAITLSVVASSHSSASAESRIFFASKIYHEQPQLCAAAGTGCGKVAADTWCQQIGYENAMSFRIAPDNRQVQRARLVNSGGLCGEDTCNGFHFVKCRRDTKQ